MGTHRSLGITGLGSEGELQGVHVCFVHSHKSINQPRFWLMISLPTIYVGKGQNLRFPLVILFLSPHPSIFRGITQAARDGNINIMNHAGQTQIASYHRDFPHLLLLHSRSTASSVPAFSPSSLQRPSSHKYSL